MGNNATVLIRTDGADDIKQNAQEFADNMIDAINHVASFDSPKDFPVGSHANPAMVVEVHHADYARIVSVGGNYGFVLGEIYLPSWRDRRKFAVEAVRAIMQKHSIKPEEL